MHQTVLSFWFEELTPKMWWTKSEALDNEIKERFSVLHEQAKQNELYAWRQTAKSALAEVIILDQFSRNIYRDTAKAFENDSQALALAQVAIDKGFHNELSKDEKSFLYIPFMHSESSAIHELAVNLYQDLGNESNFEFELKHKAIIDRFGRYPHRNALLNRVSTEEELEFLKQPGSGF